MSDGTQVWMTVGFDAPSKVDLPLDSLVSVAAGNLTGLTVLDAAYESLTLTIAVVIKFAAEYTTKVSQSVRDSQNIFVPSTG